MEKKNLDEIYENFSAENCHYESSFLKNEDQLCKPQLNGF